MFCYCLTGWDQGCMTMTKGERAVLTIAGYKGYGAQGFPAWGYPFYIINKMKCSEAYQIELNANVNLYMKTHM